MSLITESLTVDVPDRAAYDQWTQFEESPRFTEGAEGVVHDDEGRHHPTWARGGRIGQAGSR